MPNCIIPCTLTHGVKRFAFPAIAICLSSCAHGVFSIPPATFTYYENPQGTGRAISIESTGLIVDTNADMGITLGYSHKTYFFEGQNSHGIFGWHSPPFLENDEKNVSQLVTHYGLVAKEMPQIGLETKNIAAYSITNTGLVVNTGKHRLGLTLGLSWYARLFLPNEFDGIVFINTGKDSSTQQIFSIENAH